jgi:uroporphyrinogen-III synthase
LSRSRLAGVRVVVTRSHAQAASLTEAFAAAGALVESLPLLEIIPPADEAPLRKALTELARFDWVVFTSVNAVQAVLHKAGAWPESVRVAAVGPATRAALLRAKVVVDLEAGTAGGTANASGLLAVLRNCQKDAGTRSRPRVLLPQAADARPTLEEGLREAGYDVERVVAYDKRLPEGAPETAHRLFSDQPLGWVTFSSPRVVRHFVGLFGAAWPTRKTELDAASLGPVTSGALQEQGIEPAVEASEPSPDALVAAVAGELEKRTPYQPI